MRTAVSAQRATSGGLQSISGGGGGGGGKANTAENLSGAAKGERCVVSLA